MPRLSDDHYLAFHDALRKVWLEHPHVFAYIRAADQWYLHDYLLPTKELTGEQLLAHRRQVTADQPSLPQSAGRALQSLELVLAGGVRPGASYHRDDKVKRMVIYGLVNPEPDVDMLARAIIEIARQLADQDDPKDDASQSSAA